MAAKGPKKEKQKWGTGKAKEPKKAKTVVPAFVNKTPKGDKKDTSEEMEPAYRPCAVEAAWQDYWEATGLYKGDEVAAAGRPYEEKFVMVIPPPNVTGSLHLGHALTSAVEDTLVRWHRMCGDSTVWVPGTDHAGIATQVVVEKMLMRDEGVSRHDLGRDAFVEKVWEWKEQYGNRITNQLRCLGSSADWSREAFTMDEQLSTAVKEAFVRMYNDGLIYRATRLVNWSCALKSAISEIEVDYIDLEGRTKLSVPGHEKGRKYEFGVITSFAYKVEDSEEEIVVATTRLETMLGDTAVAVHPEDPRYTHLHGKFVVHPFGGRRIPIVLDSELVDMSFGTGAVKITPAHDPNDFLCGKRHDLPFINVLDDVGAINESGGEFAGMMRYDARFKVEKRLEEMGLYRGKADNKMRLGKCSRSGDIIEPMLKPQWYVSCENMALRAADAVRNKELELIPAFHEATWFRWLDNCRDWCISRQLWWGHRIPAYHFTVDGVHVQDDGSSDNWVAGRSEEEARATAAAKAGVSPDRITLEQDEDVLDTWFSSGLFPFSVFGWPNQTADLDAFYPTTLLETGHDILFFWVARMVMMGLQLTDKLPFTKVYLHAMVRDKSGRKMSKSKGNVIDPLEVINGCTLDKLLSKVDESTLSEKEKVISKKELTKDFPQGIPECGADALRFGLLAYTVQGRDVNLDINRVIGYRNFCNKLWNATRFAMSTVGAEFTPTPGMEVEVMASRFTCDRDRWILHRLQTTVAEVDALFRTYEFGNVVNALYSFWLNDLCDVYLELIKPVMAVDDATASEEEAGRKNCARQTLFLCLEYGVRLLHPLMPFVTEELWQRLPNRSAFSNEPSIMVASYPRPSTAANAAWSNPSLGSEMDEVKEIVHAGRSLKADYNLNPRDRPRVFIRCMTAEGRALMQRFADDVKTAMRSGDVSVVDPDAVVPDACGVKVVGENYQVVMDLTGLVEFGAEAAKFRKQLAKLQAPLNALRAKMEADTYLEKTPADVQEKNTGKLEAQSKEEAELLALIAKYEQLAGHA